MKELYKNILKALNAPDTFIEAELEPLAIIDLYRRQPEEPTQFENYDTPAVLVDWNIKYATSTKKKTDHTGTIQIDLHVVLNSTGDTSSLASDDDLDNALKLFDYIKLIQSLVDGLSSSTVAPISRISESSDTIDVNSYHIISYSDDYSEVNTPEKYDYIDDAEMVVNKTSLKNRA